MTDELSYEEVISSILAPWFTQAVPPADVEAIGPKQAAARALVAALNTKADRGTIRVICPDNEAVTAVRRYLEAFFEEPRLKKLLSRMTADGAVLASGPVIELTTNPVRLMRNVLTTISLVERQELPADLDLRDVARAICELAHEGPDAVALVEKLLGFQPSGYFEGFRERQRQKMDEHFEEMRARSKTYSPPSVPVVRRRAPVPDDPFAGGHWLPSGPWRG